MEKFRTRLSHSQMEKNTRCRERMSAPSQYTAYIDWPLPDLIGVF
jgi:hypothetical protein